jgi:hypothetical protein
MKKIKILIIIVSVMIVSSCGDKLAELNIDPDTSPTGSAPEVFTAAQAYYGIAHDAYFNETDAVLGQYWAGGPGVALLDIERYFFEPLDFNIAWSYSFLQALSDLSFVIDDAENNEALAAAADILSVFIYQSLVDHYGDIPYSTSLNGDPSKGGVISPEYDGGKAVYDLLVSRVAAAVAILADPALADDMGTEDMIFGEFVDPTDPTDVELATQLTNWIRLGNSIHLKLLMRQSISDASVGSAVTALVNSQNALFIQDESQLARIKFQGETGQNWNPMYARREQGVGQFYIASNSAVNRMTSLADPRLSVIYDVAVNTGTIVGIDQGDIVNRQELGADDVSFPSSVAIASANDVILMSHWEVMFLRAEADMRFGTIDDETAMFNGAVTAHFNYVGATIGNYLTTEAVYDPAASNEAKSNMIGLQKWISFNGLQESEGWIEARRFDTPSSPIFTGGTNPIFMTPARSQFPDGVFPVRYLYPQTELDFNARNVPGLSGVTDKPVFWDN